MKLSPSTKSLAEKKRKGKSEQGSALIIGVLTMWLIIYAISMLVHITNAFGHKMKAQMAADTAALAGARMMANNLSTIAWINDSRALIHYYKIRYGADLISAGTLGLLKARTAHLSNGSIGPSITDTKLWGNNGFAATMADTFQKTTEVRVAPWEENNSPYWTTNPLEHRQVKGQNAEEQLARFQHSLAMITKVMVEKEVYDKASLNGSELTGFFPTFKMYPEPGDERYLNIRAIDTTTDFDGETLTVTGWRMWNQDLDMTATSIGTDSWKIDATMGDRHIEATIRKDYPIEGWIFAEYTESQGDLQIAHETVYIDTINGIILTDTMQIQIEPLDDGSTRITRTENGQTTTFRYKYESGQLLVYDTTSGSFVDPNPNGGGEDSTEVNGTQVRVENFTSINVGTAVFWVDRVTIGDFTIFYNNPVRIISHLYGFNILAESDAVHVNGLSTDNANCRWQQVSYQHQSDNTRHRMCTVEDEVEWKYEYVREPSYLKEERAQEDPNLVDRYSRHGERMATGSSIEPPNVHEWEDMLNTRTGELSKNGNGEVIYHLERQCWHLEDLNCSAPHINPTDINWCTPVANQPNGRYHDSASGQERTCPLCGGDGIVRVGVDELSSASAILSLIESAGPNPSSEVASILDMLAQYPSIVDSIKRRPSTSSDLPPLVLREDYFKYGISVGTWISGSNTEGYSGSPDMGLKGEADAFKKGDDGHFAFASARAGFRDPSTGEYVFGFYNGALSPEALQWVDSEQNLYLADWEASLVGMKTQIHSNDIDADESNDSGLTYLLRRLSSTRWRSTFFARDQYPNINIRNFNINSLDVYDYVQH